MSLLMSLMLKASRSQTRDVNKYCEGLFKAPFVPQTSRVTIFDSNGFAQVVIAFGREDTRYFSDPPNAPELPPLVALLSALVGLLLASFVPLREDRGVSGDAGDRTPEQSTECLRNRPIWLTASRMW